MAKDDVVDFEDFLAEQGESSPEGSDNSQAALLGSSPQALKAGVEEGKKLQAEAFANQLAAENLTKKETPADLLGGAIKTGAAAGLGAAEGLTYDLLDDALGLMPGVDSKDFRRAFDELYESSPKAYTAGKILGTVAPMAISPVGAAPAALSRLPMLSKAAQLAYAPATKAVQAAAKTKDLGYFGRLLGSSGDIATATALSAAGRTEGDKLDAVSEALSSPAHILPQLANVPLQTTPALLNLLSKTSPAQSAKFGKEFTKTTGLMPGSREGRELALSEIQQVAREIGEPLTAAAAAKKQQAYAGLMKSANEILELTSAAKSKSAKEIDTIVRQMAASDSPTDISKLADKVRKIAEKFDMSPDEAPIAAKVMKMVDDLSIVKPEAKLTRTEALTRKLDPETGLPVDTTKTTLRSKDVDVSSEDLQKLLDDTKAMQSKQGQTAQGLTEGPAGTTETVSRTDELTIPAVTRTEAPIKDLYKIHKALSDKVQMTSDPATQLGFKKMLAEVEGAMLNESTAKQFLESRKLYAKQAQLGRTAKDTELTESVVSPQFTDWLANLSDQTRSGAQTERVNVEALLKSVSDQPTAQRVLAESEASGKAFKQAEAIRNKFLDASSSVPGREFRGIEAAIGTADPTNMGLRSTEQGKDLQAAAEFLAPGLTTEKTPKIERAGKLGKMLNLTAEPDTNFASGGVTGTVMKLAQSEGGGISGIPYTLGGLAQKAEDIAVKTPAGIVKSAAKTFSDLPDEQLMAKSEELIRKGYKGLGALAKSAIGPTNISRNAALFMLSQDPGLKSEYARALEAGDLESSDVTSFDNMDAIPFDQFDKDNSDK
jgi:hypothetical protein